MKNIYYGKKIIKTALILICVCGIFRGAAGLPDHSGVFIGFKGAGRDKGFTAFAGYRLAPGPDGRRLSRASRSRG